MKARYIAMAGLCLLAGNAAAGGFSEIGVGAKVGTLGLGIEGIKPVAPKLDLRLGLNKFDYEADETFDNTDYSAKLNMQTIAALADWHPANNGFFISGGAMLNDNKLDASANVTAADPVTIGTKTITSGKVTTGISFDDVSPYLGIGYRQPFNGVKGWSFVAEAGVLFQGNPKITLAESTGTVSQSDIDDEINKIRDDVDVLKNLPVISLGAVYRF